MEIKFTDEQEKQFIEDKYIRIVGDNYDFYFELDDKNNICYFEIIKKENKRIKQKYFFDTDELEKLIPKRLNDPSYYRNDPLCPNCGTYMIYNFEHCPKCGQQIDYSKE